MEAHNINVVARDLLIEAFSLFSKTFFKILSQQHTHLNSCSKNYTTKISKFTALSSLLADVVPKIGFCLSVIILHKDLLTNLMRLPSSFFDQTPVGRILARFSKDIEVIDMSLPHSVNALIYIMFEVLLTRVR